jgi:hypothetical protein
MPSIGVCMKLRIFSDGTSYNTKVIDTVTGHVMKDVIGVEWKVDMESTLAIATIHFVNVPVEIVGATEYPVEGREIQLDNIL